MTHLAVNNMQTFSMATLELFEKVLG